MKQHKNANRSGFKEAILLVLDSDFKLILSNTLYQTFRLLNLVNWILSKSSFWSNLIQTFNRTKVIISKIRISFKLEIIHMIDLEKTRLIKSLTSFLVLSLFAYHQKSICILSRARKSINLHLIRHLNLSKCQKKSLVSLQFKKMP